MTHLTLDEFNTLFAQKATVAERAHWTDHLLECDTCATRFKAMHALHEELGAPRKTIIPLRYTLGAAAVIFMCAFPYFTTAPSSDIPIRTAQHQEAAPTPAPEKGFALLDQVKDVNYRNALARWGSETDLATLVQLSSK